MNLRLSLSLSLSLSLCGEVTASDVVNKFDD